MALGLLSSRGTLLEVAVTDSEITTQLLREIRDQIARTNERLDGTNERLDRGFVAVNERIDATNERLAVVETVVRDCAQQLVMLGRYVKNSTEDIRARLTKLENE
jgi:hypothetical protein